MPIEDVRLNDASMRENFIEQIFCYRRWKTLSHHQRITREALVQFHTQHKCVLLTHRRLYDHELGQLVAKAGEYSPTDLTNRYGERFMEALKVKTTVSKHGNVLQHLAGHLKKHLSATERAKLQEMIQDYHRRITPLAVPLTLIKHYVRIRGIRYLLDQVYLNPHPKELMLRS